MCTEGKVDNEMPVDIGGKSYCTATEVALQLGISRQTLWRWRQSGDVPSGRRFKGQQVVFNEAEQALIRQQLHRLGETRGVADDIYLDNQSTTRPLREVVEAMARATESGFGNPSSAHSRGRVARDLLDEARESVAELCGSDTASLIFTSGATEANNIVLQLPISSPALELDKVVTTSIEHSSVLGTCEYLESKGIEVVYLKPGNDGRIPETALEPLEIDQHTLLSVHWVNNETGVIQPVEQLSRFAREKGALFHTDAAQALGKVPVDFDSQEFDYMTCSAHKVHGPQGTGALVFREGAPLKPLLYGGSQEQQTRPGTENLPGIVGFGAAARLRRVDFRAAATHCRTQRDYLETSLLNRVIGACRNGSARYRVPGACNLRFEGIDGQALVAQLDLRGIYVSQSSACTNMRPEPSYVLTEMGLSEEAAYESIRMGLSIDTTSAEVLRAIDGVTEVLQKLGAIVLDTPDIADQEASNS